MRRVVALSVLSAALAGCGASRREPEVVDGTRLLHVPPLAAGLRITIAPDLPDDALPETMQRVAEVLAADGGRLRLRWTGRVRRETPESADERTTWLRARTAAGSRNVPPPPARARFEDAEVTGTIEFPDFATAN